MNISKLRSFLGMVQHYGKYLRSLADASAPFNNLLKKTVPWGWTSACEEAFGKVKTMLVCVDTLTNFDSTKPVFLVANASAGCQGAVICHKVDGKDIPILSTCFEGTAVEKNYSQIEREALVIVFRVRKLSSISGAEILFCTRGHKPLTTTFGPKKGILATTASWPKRRALILMNYAFDIQYMPAAKFGNADSLSHLPEGPDRNFEKEMEHNIFTVFLTEVNMVHQFLTLLIMVDDVADATSQDSVFPQVAALVSNVWTLRVDACLEGFCQCRLRLTIHKGCLLWSMQMVIPPKFQNIFMKAILVKQK